MKVWSYAVLVCITATSLVGCIELGPDRQTAAALRQELPKFRGECERLNKQVSELTKAVAELRREVVVLREAKTAAPPTPATPTVHLATPAGKDREPVPDRSVVQDKGVPKDTELCEIIETHIAAVEGILSQGNVDSMDTLVDDLAAAFEANLRKFSRDPRIGEIRDAAANMRSNFLSAAKQSHLATNPYLKNVRQKSINDGRKYAKTLRAVCE
jgi:hypothetical protein